MGSGNILTMGMGKFSQIRERMGKFHKMCEWDF